jgi:DNA-binding MarR family transcriptional regulator
VFLNVGVLSGTVRAAVTRFLGRHGITSMGAFNVLTVLHGERSPLPPSVIAERMMVSRPTITGLIDSLERRRLVQREASADDGRQRVVRLSRQGRRLIDPVVPELHRFERDLFAGISRREMEAFRTTIAKLQQRVMELSPEAPVGI